jgi:hypothetical protein
MGNCGCRAKHQYEVVMKSGAVVFTSSSKATADNVSKRYPDSEVRETAPATPPAVQ